jgi:adenosylmethionine-8-amino-7-oxononanoate aminotransferase
MQINPVKKTSKQQVSRFLMLNEDHKLNNLNEQSASGANESSDYLDKTSSVTCVNDGSGNTLVSDIINTLTTSQNLSIKVPSKSKPKIKLSHQLNGSVPLTIYHQNISGLRWKANELLSQLYPTFPHILSLGASYEPLRITADIF